MKVCYVVLLLLHAAMWTDGLTDTVKAKERY
jgi:hypothetical protein